MTMLYPDPTVCSTGMFHLRALKDSDASDNQTVLIPQLIRPERENFLCN